MHCRLTGHVQGVDAEEAPYAHQSEKGSALLIKLALTEVEAVPVVDMATKMGGLVQMVGMHTAGIYSDMTVDGPEIGTLVVIVDRAKNLPNKKSMGKQNPYCAARLGKEAKKTATDKRGGQTPKW